MNNFNGLVAYFKVVVNGFPWATKRTTTTLRNRGRLVQGFHFRREKQSLSSATSHTDDDFAKNFVLLQSCYGIQRPPKFTSYKLLDGLIDISTMVNLLFFTTCISCITALNSLHRLAFVFVLKSIPISNSS